MSTSELPSRDKDVWTRALQVASENPAIELGTAGILDHLRHLIETGRLIDRDSIDYEATMPLMEALRTNAADFDHEDIGYYKDYELLNTAKAIVDVALGVSDD